MHARLNNAPPECVNASAAFMDALTPCMLGFMHVQAPWCMCQAHCLRTCVGYMQVPTACASNRMTAQRQPPTWTTGGQHPPIESPAVA
eukprot:194960-Chlamydomonas_euryale.AAC.12